MTSKPLQQAIWGSYRDGQCDDKRPSEAWHRAADAAIAYVAVAEGKWTQEKADRWLTRHERAVQVSTPLLRIWVTSVKQGQYCRAFTPGGPDDLPGPAVPFVYVGRRLGQYQASVLGNPFRREVNEDEVMESSAITRYREWLQGKLVVGSVEMEELLRIMRLGLGEHGVALGCWCAGTQAECHANEIRRAVQALWGVGWQ